MDAVEPITPEETSVSNNLADNFPVTPSLLSKLKTLFGKSSAKNIPEALPDDIPEPEEPFVVTFSGTNAGEDASCDKTWAEVQAAWAAGKRFIVWFSSTGSSAFSSLQLNPRFSGLGTSLTQFQAFGHIVNLHDNPLQVIFVDCTLNSSGVTNVSTLTYLAITGSK